VEGKGGYGFRVEELQGYLTHIKPSLPLWSHRRTLCLVPLQGPRGALFLLSEVPLQGFGWNRLTKAVDAALNHRESKRERANDREREKERVRSSESERERYSNVRVSESQTYSNVRLNERFV